MDYVKNIDKLLDMMEDGISLEEFHKEDSEIDNFDIAYNECSIEFQTMLDAGEVMYGSKKSVIDKLLAKKGYKNKIIEKYNKGFLSDNKPELIKRDYKSLPGHPGWVVLEFGRPRHLLIKEQKEQKERERVEKEFSLAEKCWKNKPLKKLIK